MHHFSGRWGLPMGKMLKPLSLQTCFSYRRHLSFSKHHDQSVLGIYPSNHFLFPVNPHWFLMCSLLYSICTLTITAVARYFTWAPSAAMCRCTQLFPHSRHIQYVGRDPTLLPIIHIHIPVVCRSTWSIYKGNCRSYKTYSSWCCI